MTKDDQRRLEFWKTEYERAAERYENIYKALWQNFQYLALVSAAILTFGKDSLPPGVIMLLAGLPVLFWFFAQYIPMDRYGAAARERLAEIEKEFNEYFAKYSGKSKIIPKFRHYTEFAKNFQGTNREKGLFGSEWRVRKAVQVFAVIMFILWPVLVAWAFAYPKFFAGEKKSTAHEFTEIRQDLKTLKRILLSRVPATFTPTLSISTPTPSRTTAPMPTPSPIVTPTPTMTPTAAQTQTPTPRN